MDNILTNKQIKTIIVLSGARRLPDLESQIFADRRLTRFYLINLCKEYIWFSPTHTGPEMAYYYARRSDTRWTEAEHLFVANPKLAFYYAQSVIRGRWIEAEYHMQQKDNRVWYSYLRYVVNNPFL